GLPHDHRDDRVHIEPAAGATARGVDGERPQHDSAGVRRRPPHRPTDPDVEERAMNRDDVNWRGYWPACPTPFTASGEVDVDSLKALVEWYVGEGMHGIFINGTTGEWFSQSPEERRLVADTAIEQVAGRITVVIGCTSLTAAQAVELGRHAIAAGADGIGSTPPPDSKTHADETLGYHQGNSVCLGGPPRVYNRPPGRSRDIRPQLP